MFTWTDQPYSTMWSHLRTLSNQHNANRLLRNEFGGTRTQPSPQSDLLKRKAAELSYCILQAHEYYQAADSVTVNTSPLLYFYGMLSLAKAVIVANDPEILLEHIKYHGLQVCRAGTLEDQVAILNGGVFDDWVFTVGGFRFPKGAEFRLKSTLSISPELSGMYERYYSDNARCVNLYDITMLSNNPYKVRLSLGVNTKEEAYAKIPELADDFDVVTECNGQFVSLVSKPSLSKPPEYLTEYNPVVGGRYIVGPLLFTLKNTSSRYLSPPLSDYIVMHILSDCVRYQQDLWGSVVEGKQTGILGLIDLFIAVSKRRFPNLILDQLYGESFRYGSPGYLT